MHVLAILASLAALVSAHPMTFEDHHEMIAPEYEMPSGSGFGSASAFYEHEMPSGSGFGSASAFHDYDMMTSYGSGSGSGFGTYDFNSYSPEMEGDMYMPEDPMMDFQGMGSGIDEGLTHLYEDMATFGEDMAQTLDEGVPGDMAEANDEEIETLEGTFTEDLTHLNADFAAFEGDFGMGSGTGDIDEDLTHFYADMASLNQDMAGAVEEGITAIYGGDMAPEDMAGATDEGLPHDIYEDIIAFQEDMNTFDGTMEADMGIVVHDLPGDTTAEAVEEGMEAPHSYQGMAGGAIDEGTMADDTYMAGATGYGWGGYCAGKYYWWIPAAWFC